MYLLQKIRDLLNTQESVSDLKLFTNILGEEVISFKLDNETYILTLEVLNNE